jgi:hypothetical protein
MSKIKQGIKTRKRKGWPGGVSDTLLQDLWRAVVRREWEGKCAFEGTYYRDEPGQGYYCDGALECHHIVKRSRLHLKYAPSNGILLCQYHHNLSGLRVWRGRIEERVGADKMEYLDAMEKMLLPEYLSMHGQTRGEFLIYQKGYLRALLDGAEGGA